jgi:hypothetical protein
MGGDTPRSKDEHMDDNLSEDERTLIEGLRANRDEGRSGDTLEAEEIEMLLAIMDRLAPKPA